MPPTEVLFFRSADGGVPVKADRILYFFHGRDVVVLAHALTKENAVPDIDIERAIARRNEFLSNPRTHTHEESL